MALICTSQGLYIVIVTASAKVQQHSVGICFRTRTERMLITFGPLYKPASHVDEEYIPEGVHLFPKASARKTVFHLVERSGSCSVEMSLCLQ